MLSKQQTDFFHRHGYLVVEDLVEEGMVRDVVGAYEQGMAGLVDDWVAAGKLEEGMRVASFQDQLLGCYRNGLDFFQPLDISLPQGGITPDTPMHTGPEIFRLMTAPSILDAVESLIGPEITSNPIQHVRIKPPSRFVGADEHRAHITTTQWHQDRGVATADADVTNMVTVWLAITDATRHNGCLQVVGDTQHGPMMPHCPEPQMGIPDRFVNEAVAKPLEVRSGGAVFFHPLTIHGAGPNETENLRWSFDLRYNITGEPTGRAHFPEFVVRSRANPDSEMHDPVRWAQMWDDAKARLSGAEGLEFNRWNQDAPVCA